MMNQTCLCLYCCAQFLLCPQALQLHCRNSQMLSASLHGSQALVPIKELFARDAVCSTAYSARPTCTLASRGHEGAGDAPYKSCTTLVTLAVWSYACLTKRWTKLFWWEHYPQTCSDGVSAAIRLYYCKLMNVSEMMSRGFWERWKSATALPCFSTALHSRLAIPTPSSRRKKMQVSTTQIRRLAMCIFWIQMALKVRSTAPLCETSAASLSMIEMIVSSFFSVVHVLVCFFLIFFCIKKCAKS